MENRKIKKGQHTQRDETSKSKGEQCGEVGRKEGKEKNRAVKYR